MVLVVHVPRYDVYIHHTSGNTSWVTLNLMEGFMLGSRSSIMET